MSLALPYGTNSELSLSVDDDRLIGVCGAAFADLSRATEALPAQLDRALDQPLEYPALDQAVVSGDKVTLALERGVPGAVAIATALAERLIAAGIAADDVTVLQSGGEIAADAVRVRNVHEPIRIERHDPTDRGKLGFLANTRSGRAVYLNRLVTDADLVIPVGCYRGPESWSYRGVFGGLYPTFSDHDTHARFRNPHLLDTDDDAFAKSQHEIELIGWQSGTQLTVQVVPGRGDEAAEVVVGETRAVGKRCAQLWSELWRAEMPERADLVVASLSGERAQSWEQVGRALDAAMHVVEDGGAIALCTELSAPLGPALDLFTKQEDRDVAVAEIRKVRPVDAFPALLLDRAQRRVRVYLLSNLDATVVEDLGIARVDAPDDIGRLAARRRSCIVLADAQHALPVPA